jgi:DNA invertase Pin-like site-specific DNA recombinase
MGRYSNPNIVSRLERVLSGQGRDRVSHRPVPSLRQKQTRLTDSQRSEVVARYEAGESSNALAREFGVDRRTATRIIRDAGVELRYRAEVDVDAARELYESGLSLVKVGERLGVSPGTILNLFQRVGIATREVGTNQWTAPAARHR